MNGADEGFISDRMPEYEQSESLKDYYLAKARVSRGVGQGRFVETHEENLLGGLLYELNEIKGILDCLRLPWMKLADAFFQGYAALSLQSDFPLFSKRNNLLVSRFAELMVELSRENPFIEALLNDNLSCIKNVEKLQETYKETAYYSIAVDDKLIYGLSLKQLVEIHDTIERFLGRGNISFREYEKSDSCAVDVSMSVYLYADSASYGVSYDVDTDTEEGEMRFISSKQMKYVIRQMQRFLNCVEEEGTTMDDTNEFSVIIQQDHVSRELVVRDTPSIHKCVRQHDEEALTNDFTICANGLYLHDLSIRQLKKVSVQLEEFLDSVDKQWKELRILPKELKEGIE